jgi:hypothetical protein
VKVKRFHLFPDALIAADANSRGGSEAQGFRLEENKGSVELSVTLRPDVYVRPVNTAASQIVGLWWRTLKPRLETIVTPQGFVWRVPVASFCIDKKGRRHDPAECQTIQNYKSFSFWECHRVGEEMWPALPKMNHRP